MSIKNLLAARQALKEKALSPNKILIYGDSKTGKTQFVGTAAKMDQIDNIWWFDLEHGVETLLHSDLTDEQLEKIHVFNVVDNPNNPVAGETILKAFTAKQPVPICHEHGKVRCPLCGSEDKTDWNLISMGKRDLVVIDSGSQLATSVHNIALRDGGYKDKRLYYVDSSKMLNDIFTCTQAVNTNIVMITHSLDITDDEGKILKTVPLILSQNYSKNVGKYFGQVVYLSVELRKHKIGSSSTYKPTLLTGSRTGAKLENAKEYPSMEDLLFPESTT